MNTENLNLILSKIQPVLADLGNKLGVGGKHLWAVIIRQQYIDGFIALFWVVFGIMLFIGMLKLTKWVIKKSKEERRDLNDEDNVAWMFLIAIGVVVGAIMIIEGGSYAINHLLNPEYQAVQSIIQMINKK